MRTEVLIKNLRTLVLTTNLQRIPAWRVPLQPLDGEPELDLQAVLMAVYNPAKFNLAINYCQEAARL